MALSVRTRFEVLKRDGFTCRYCGGVSPEVVLEVDHVVPVCEGGTDDPINLVTSCWSCNHGKAGVPLDTVIDGEDPHDRAIMLLERDRQMREYNTVMLASRKKRDIYAWDLIRYWMNDPKCESFPRRDYTWLMNTLEWLPGEIIRGFMDIAVQKGIDEFRYVKGCVRNVRESRQVVSNG